MAQGIPLLEHHFTCPYCWEPISMVLDGSTEDQEYIEDCEVCCNPIQISFAIVNGELTYFEAEQVQ